MITTDYELEDTGNGSVVKSVSWKTKDQECLAVLSDTHPEKYIYSSCLIDDKKPVIAPTMMSLANCCLAAFTHLAVIPPQEFSAIPCENIH